MHRQICTVVLAASVAVLLYSPSRASNSQVAGRKSQVAGRKSQVAGHVCGRLVVCRVLTQLSNLSNQVSKAEELGLELVLHGSPVCAPDKRGRTPLVKPTHTHTHTHTKHTHTHTHTHICI